ncbi:MAG: hypothetical protein DMG79_05685 [Acidobacteria bacterium]|nr:MAG: hypothetical protein DMG79_05685 [Acidobacteriota bacterium]
MFAPDFWANGNLSVRRGWWSTMGFFGSGLVRIFPWDESSAFSSAGGGISRASKCGYARDSSPRLKDGSARNDATGKENSIGHNPN